MAGNPIEHGENFPFPGPLFAQNEEENLPPAKQLWGCGELILLVDDEPDVLDVTRSLLVHYGYQVITAFNGVDALGSYEQSKKEIKMVLLDMMMPVMDGPETIRILRRLAPRLPILAISGLMQGEELQKRLGNSEIPLLSKPYSTAQLLRQIKVSLSRNGLEE